MNCARLKFTPYRRSVWSSADSVANKAVHITKVYSMDSRSSSVYSESILNGYLNPSHTSLANGPKPAKVPVAIPEIFVCNELDAQQHTVGHNAQHTAIVLDEQHTTNIGENHPYRTLSTTLSPSTSRNSLSSSVSSTNSKFSSISNEEDWELENLNEIVDSRIDQKLRFQGSPQLISLLTQFESRYEEEKMQHRSSKSKRVFAKEELLSAVHADKINDKRHFDYVNERVMADYYGHSSKGTLQINWDDLAEIIIFGDSFKNLFYDNDNVLFYYLLHGEQEHGDFVYHNFLRNVNIPNVEVDLYKFLQGLLKDLATYDEILELYSSSNNNVGSEKLFDTFRSYTTFNGFNIPLAHAMFGNWLLSYNKDETVENNYDNEFILKYFRKAARFALGIRKLVSNHYFESALSKFSGNDLLLLKTYLNKHNTFALSISLHNFGEFYQVHHAYDISINLWELNCHLTKDSESGNLAILGLTNGFGFGNKYKTLNKLGKKSKTNKFNTKRRIAQLYRILIKDGSTEEVGTSWVWKEKYD